MNFTARILRGSPVWRAWRDHHRVGGDIRGVRFSWIPGDDYIASGKLDRGQVEALSGHSSVQLEMTSVDALRLIPALSPAVEPEPLPMPIVSVQPPVVQPPVVQPPVVQHVHVSQRHGRHGGKGRH